jgi:hypothetical protein
VETLIGDIEDRKRVEPIEDKCTRRLNGNLDDRGA